MSIVVRNSNSSFWGALFAILTLLAAPLHSALAQEVAIAQEPPTTPKPTSQESTVTVVEADGSPIVGVLIREGEHQLAAAFTDENGQARWKSSGGPWSFTHAEFLARTVEQLEPTITLESARWLLCDLRIEDRPEARLLGPTLTISGKTIPFVHYLGRYRTPPISSSSTEGEIRLGEYPPIPIRWEAGVGSWDLGRVSLKGPSQVIRFVDEQGLAIPGVSIQAAHVREGCALRSDNSWTSDEDGEWWVGGLAETFAGDVRVRGFLSKKFEVSRRYGTTQAVVLRRGLVLEFKWIDANGDSIVPKTSYADPYGRESRVENIDRFRIDPEKPVKVQYQVELGPGGSLILPPPSEWAAPQATTVAVTHELLSELGVVQNFYSNSISRKGVVIPKWCMLRVLVKDSRGRLVPNARLLLENCGRNLTLESDAQGEVLTRCLIGSRCVLRTGTESVTFRPQSYEQEIVVEMAPGVDVAGVVELSQGSGDIEGWIRVTNARHELQPMPEPESLRKIYSLGTEDLRVQMLTPEFDLEQLPPNTPLRVVIYYVARSGEWKEHSLVVERAQEIPKVITIE